MKTRSLLLVTLFVACNIPKPLTFAADDSQSIKFASPPDTGGKPLMEALYQRKTEREIKPEKLSVEQLGNLLWAAFGINRPANDHRTAPSAMNSQEMDIYAATAEGLYVYRPKPHQLELVSKQDLRAQTGGAAFATNAPVTLIYVADLSRLDKASGDTRVIYANFDAGCICQNVYLFCASENLATVVHDLNRGPLEAALKLKPEQRIIMAQAVGKPL